MSELEKENIDQDTEINITKIDDEQIRKRIAKLMKIVYSKNQNLARQAYPLLVQLQEEQDARAYNKLTAHMANLSANISDIINIG